MTYICNQSYSTSTAKWGLQAKFENIQVFTINQLHKNSLNVFDISLKLISQLFYPNSTRNPTSMNTAFPKLLNSLNRIPHKTTHRHIRCGLKHTWLQPTEGFSSCIRKAWDRTSQIPELLMVTFDCMSNIWIDQEICPKSSLSCTIKGNYYRR